MKENKAEESSNSMLGASKTTQRGGSVVAGKTNMFVENMEKIRRYKNGP